MSEKTDLVAAIDKVVKDYPSEIQAMVFSAVSCAGLYGIAHRHGEACLRCSWDPERFRRLTRESQDK